MKEVLVIILIVAAIIGLYTMKRRKGKKNQASCCGKGYGSKFPEEE